MGIHSQINIENDQALMDAVRSGKTSALEHIYVKNYPMIRDYILKNSGSEIDAKDIFQDAMIVLHEKIMDPQFLLSSKISSFLYAISKNLWLKHLRAVKKAPEHRIQEDDQFADEIVDTYKEQESRLDRVLKNLALLGQSCQRILELFFFQKASMQEIANEMGYTNEANAKNQKYKCMKKLKQKLGVG